MRILPIPALFILFSSLSTYAQAIQRNTNESAEAFAKRIFKTDELAHPVIETKEWDSTKKVIICFVDFLSNDGDGILGYLLIPMGPGIYKKTLIDTFWSGGGTSKITIESVLFANADKDKARELVVMTSSKSHPPRFADQYPEGYYYENYVYDNPDLNNPPKQLVCYKQLSEKLSEGFEGTIYSKKGTVVKKETAPYKTVTGLRKALKDWGY